MVWSKSVIRTPLQPILPAYNSTIVTGSRFWIGTFIRHSRSSVHPRDCHSMVSCARSTAWFSSLLVSRWYLVTRLHFRRNGYTQTTVPRGLWNRSTVPYVQVTILLSFAQRKQLLTRCISSIHKRILKTPTEDIWPGVTELQDYKSNFPCWNQKQLEKQVKIITNFIRTGPVSFQFWLLLLQVKGMGTVGLDLLEQTLIYDPTKRISAKRMLEHEYFDGFDKHLLVPSHW